MKIAAISDLHVESAANRRAVSAMATFLRELRPDVLLVLGDVCNGPYEVGAVLARFADIGRRRLYIPGNHELWCADQDARTLYYRTLPEMAVREGFDFPLDAPIMVDGVAFVGTMGWYDGSFGHPSHDRSTLSAKSFGGRALLDARHVRWIGADGPLADADVTSLLCDDLEDQLRAVPTECTTIIGATHMIPHAGLLGPRWDRDAGMRYFRAFQGAERLGDVLSADSRVRHVVAGHNHERLSVVASGTHWHLAPLGNLRGEEAFDPDLHTTVVDVD